jgi:hypothetical protein
LESAININRPANSTAAEIAIFSLNDLKKETDVPNATKSPIQFLFPNNNFGNRQNKMKNGYPRTNAKNLKNFFVPKIKSNTTNRAKNMKNL